MFPSSGGLSGGDRVERIELIGTSPNYFELLGARPELGRTYTQSEWIPGFLDGLVISDGLWNRQFGSDPHIIGRRVRLLARAQKHTQPFLDFARIHEAQRLRVRPTIM